MIYFQFLIGFITYLTLAVASYSKMIQASRWFIPSGLLAALIANWTWLSIARSESNGSDLLIKGLVWDSMLVLTYLFVPIVFFDAQLKGFQFLGLLLIVLGMMCVKL